MSSVILKLHYYGVVCFSYKICSHMLKGGCPFFYFYCAGMFKQNHWEQTSMCSANNQVYRTKIIITLQEVICATDGGMIYLILENELYN